MEWSVGERKKRKVLKLRDEMRVDFKGLGVGWMDGNIIHIGVIFKLLFCENTNHACTHHISLIDVWKIRQNQETINLLPILYRF